MPLYKDSKILSEFRGTPYLERFVNIGLGGGNPRRVNGNIGLSSGEPRRVDAFAEAAAKALAQCRRKMSAAETVAARWRECVEGRLADKCFVSSVEGDIVFVAAENAQVRQMLAFAERKILERLNSFAGCENIKKIRFS